MPKTVLSFLTEDFPFRQQSSDSEIVALDHSYSRSWNSHPVSVYARPVIQLFVNKDIRLDLHNRFGEELDIDVESLDTAPCAQLQDPAKCKALLEEVERHVRTQQKCIPDEIWDEERITRQGWTKVQNSAFDRLLRILDGERVARLVREPLGSLPSTYIARKNSLDKSTRRVRQLFADLMWDPVLLQWLHSVIIENLPVSYCEAYVEILQTLNAKLPNLVQRIFSRCPGGSFKPTIAGDSLLALLKRSWDPITPLLNNHRMPKKLPGPPIFVVVPSGQTQNPHFPRVKFWYNQLNHLGKLITLPIPIVNEPSVTIAKQLEVTINTVRAKVTELKVSLPQRPIILIGWNSGSLVALQTSLIESVSAVICMGFAMSGMQGNKQLDDCFLDSKTPTLFCIGQFDGACNLDDLEDFRGYMKCETGIVVVGGADGNLHMSSKHKQTFGLTQSMVDRCIVEEIYNFLNHALSNITTPVSPTAASHEKKSENSLTKTENSGSTTPLPRKSRKRDRSIDEQDTPNKRGPGRPRAPKSSRLSSTKTSPTLEPSQTVTHAAATTATSVLTKDLSQIRPMKPITTNVRKSDGTSLGSPTKNPISIGKLGSLSNLSQQGSLKVSSPIRDEHRMVNPQDVLGIARRGDSKAPT